MMLVQAEIWTVAKTDQGNAVLLRPLGSDVAVPIFIGQLEAQSILIGMAHVPMPRPNTHELMMTLLGSIQYKLNRVEITDIRDGVFYAALHIHSPQSEVVQDSRPSDALALAVRAGSPIFVSDAVIDEAGVSLDTIIEEGEGDTSLEPNQEIEEEKLKKSLNRAINEENYEEAARIRDALESMGDETQS